MRKILVSSIVTLLAPALIPFDAKAADWTMRLQLRGRTIEGRPIQWNERQVLLLDRDGTLWDFAPSEATHFQKISNSFQSYSQAEMRARLQREFGDKFEVSGTGHYLVVHPAGQRDLWADRFEELYRSMTVYFNARSIRLAAVQFPLVAVVYPDRAQFQQQAKREGVMASAGLLGYYSPTTNRVLLFDVTAGRSTGVPWHINAETIIHEAAHQTAFNTGVHQRLSQTPRWLAEGLATMFEARGVWNSAHYPNQADRINVGRLQEIRRYAAAHRGILPLEELIGGDDAFRGRPELAYSQSWALTFLLAETEPRKYSAYLARTAARTPLKDYTRQERLADFQAIFGGDWRMLEARLLRFLDSLPETPAR